MPEIRRETKLPAIESSVGILQPSKARGTCTADAKAVIAHLTGNKLCTGGEVVRLTPADVDSPGDQLLIYATQANGYTLVDYHDVALIDEQVIVDLGRKPGDRAYMASDYYSLLTRLQR